jgi:hypothetical protein
MPTRGVDERLAHWKDVAPDADKAGLLLGNGASIAIWERFRYVTLYERATAEDIEHPLSEADKRIFEAMRTPNFEASLAALSTARMVGEILGFVLFQKLL